MKTLAGVFEKIREIVSIDFFSKLEFQAYTDRYGIKATDCSFADGNILVPFILKDWKTRQYIKKTLKKTGYDVKEFPNPFRLKAYKNDEMFIIDTPNTSTRPTPWGWRADKSRIGIMPIKYVPKESVDYYEVTDIPNTTGLVGVRCKSHYYEEIKKLLSVYGKVMGG